MGKVRAVIVEDEMIIGVELEESLRSFGYEVIGLFASAEEALSQIERTPPDIVLMDINLAGLMDGAEAAAILIRRFRIPVIFLSAYNDSETIERAKSAGPFAYLTKPFNSRDIRATIELALARHRLEENSRIHEELLLATVNTIGDSVITFDQEGGIQFLNRAAEKRLGVTPEESVGARLSRYVEIEPLVDTEGPTPSIDELLRSGQSGRTVRCVATVEGGAVRFPAEICVFPFGCIDGEPGTAEASATAPGPSASLSAGTVAGVVSIRDTGTLDRDPAEPDHAFIRKSKRETSNRNLQ